MKLCMRPLWLGSLCLASFALSLPHTAQASAAPQQTTETTVDDLQTIQLEAFHKVIIMGNLQVQIVQKKGKPSLSLPPGNHLKEALEVQLDHRDGTLSLRPRRGKEQTCENLPLYLTVNELTDLEILGGGDVDFPKGIQTNALCVQVKGSGTVDFEQAVQTQGNLSLQVMGSGHIELEKGASCLAYEGRINGSGTINTEGKLRCTSKLNAEMSGSGRISFEHIQCMAQNIKLQGSGKYYGIKVRASTTQVNILGSGEVYLAGKTHQANYSVQGSGYIDALDFQSEQVEVDGRNPRSTIRCHSDLIIEGKIQNNCTLEYTGKAHLNLKVQDGNVRKI